MAEVTGEITAGVIAEQKRHSFLVDLIIRLVREKPLGTIGGSIILLLVLVAALADVLAPYGMNDVHLIDRLSPPSTTYILGTDNLGRDLLSRIIYGARISLTVGLVASTIGVFVSATVAMISGYFGGKTDLIIQRIVDTLLCFPTMVMLLTIIAIIGPGLWKVIFTIAFSSSYHGIRVKRSAVLAVKENVYIEATRAIGVPVSRILIKHIFPNIFAVIIVVFTIGLGSAIVLEATLSFLGFGVPPPAPSWGGMLSGGGRQYLLQAPWMAFWPGLALALVVWGINMLGDALRDLLDPRLRGGLGRYAGVKSRIPKP